MDKFLAACFIILSISCAHPYQPDVKEMKDLFSQLEDSVLTRKHFLLIDSTITGWGEMFKSPAKNDRILNADDIDCIVAEMHNDKQNVWTNKVFDSARIVTQKQIDSIASPDPFMKTPTHYSFSLPYFNRQKNYCILLYSYYCGNLCAEESIRLYKKVKNKWIFVKSYFSVVS
jgi:hypothetical protein